MQYQNSGGYQPHQQHPTPGNQPMPPTQPTQPSQPAPQTQPAPNPNSVTFTADAKVLELIGMVHPELASAMISLAVKKFSEESDFVNYFVLDEYKNTIIEQNTDQQGPSSNDTNTTSTQVNTEQSAQPSMDFTSW